MHAPTRFTDPDAVEAWDALFRWRDRERLHDTTVEDTWERVATALASCEGSEEARWADRFADAFRQWQLLPDERLLRSAGTGAEALALADPCAVVNAAVFVIASPFSAPVFKHAACADAATLAVRLLDDAVLTAADAQAAPPAVRIGMIGISDALRALRVPEVGEQANRQAAGIGQAFAVGCLRGAVDLAVERGARAQADPEFLSRWQTRGAPAPLLDRAARHGLRFLELTAIQPHPALARLANGVADGIDFGARAVVGAREGLRTALQPYFDCAIPD